MGKGKQFTKADWDRHLGDFGAITDLGGYMFWRYVYCSFTFLYFKQKSTNVILYEVELM